MVAEATSFRARSSGDDRAMPASSYTPPDEAASSTFFCAAPKSRGGYLARTIRSLGRRSDGIAARAILLKTGLDHQLDCGIQADPTRAREQQPEIGEAVERFVEVNEVSEVRHLFQLHRENRDRHVDDHRNGDESHPQSRDGKGASDEFRVCGQRSVECRVGNPPTRKVRREA